MTLPTDILSNPDITGNGPPQDETPKKRARGRPRTVKPDQQEKKKRGRPPKAPVPLSEGATSSLTPVGEDTLSSPHLDPLLPTSQTARQVPVPSQPSLTFLAPDQVPSTSFTEVQVPTPPPSNGVSTPTAAPTMSKSDEKLCEKYWDRTAVNWDRIKRVQGQTGQYLRCFNEIGWAGWDPKIHCWSTRSLDQVAAALGVQNSTGEVYGKEIVARSSFFEESRWAALARWVRKMDQVHLSPPPPGRVVYQNGIVDYTDMTVHKHSSPFGEHHYTSAIDMEFNTEPMPLNVFKFFCHLASWDPLRLNLIRWEIKRVIFRDTSAQLSFIYAGEGGTGKTTYLDWLGSLAAGGFTSFTADAFGEKFHVGRIRGQSLILADELNLHTLGDKAKTVLKQSISGDALTGEEKFGMIDTFKAKCIVVSATNRSQFIDILGSYRDSGLTRRFLLFPVEFRLPRVDKNTDMPRILREATPSIIRWACAVDSTIDPSGYAGDLSMHLVNATTGTNPDILFNWVREKCRFQPGAKGKLGKADTSYDTFHGNYTHYLRATAGPRARVPLDFTEQMQRAIQLCGHRFEKKPSNNGYYILDIILEQFATQGAQRLRLHELPPLLKMAEVPVLTTMQSGGSVVPLLYQGYAKNRDIFATRVKFMKSLGLDVRDAQKSPSEVQTDLVPDAQDHIFDISRVSESASDKILEKEMAKRLDLDEVFFNPHRTAVLFDRLSAGITLPAERVAVLHRNSKAWRGIQADEKALNAFYECDLIDYAEHFSAVQIPTTRHLYWDQPYPDCGAMRRALAKVQTFPLAGGRVHVVLNNIGKEVIPMLYKQEHVIAAASKKSGKDHDHWFLQKRPHLRDAFALFYTESYGSVYPRLQPVATETKGTVLSQTKNSFKIAVYQEMLSKLNGEFIIMTLDMRSCHSRIYAGLLDEQVEEWRKALGVENLWDYLEGFIPPKLLLGMSDRFWIKKQLKIWVYKSIQGGDIFKGQADHDPLRHLFPSLKGDELVERGNAIVESIPALLDLRKLSLRAAELPEVYFPTSSVPFKFCFVKNSSEKNKLPAFSIWDMQSVDPWDLPPFMKPVSTPQKVSRMLTGCEVVLLMKMVVTIAQQKLGIVLANESDGVAVFTRKSDADKLKFELNRAVEKHSLDFLNIPIGVEGIVSATSSKFL